MPDREAIDLSHVLAKTPYGHGFECVLCWGCTCHRYTALQEPCGKYARGNNTPKYGRTE